MVFHGEAVEADRPAKDNWLGSSWSWRSVMIHLRSGMLMKLVYTFVPYRVIPLCWMKKKCRKQEIQGACEHTVRRLPSQREEATIHHWKEPKDSVSTRSKELPVKYKANKFAWMTSSLFCQWLLHREGELQREEVRLLTDNISAHTHDVIKDQLQALTVVFLPINQMSILQPLDQRVVRSCKANFRCKMVRWILNVMENVSTATTRDVAKKLTLLDDILSVDLDWWKWEESSTAGRKDGCCFKHHQKWCLLRLCS